MRATIRTSHGDITVELWPDLAPATVANFAELATGTKEYPFTNCSGGNSGPFYDGGIFHCVIKDFAIQAGCPHGTGMGVGRQYRFPGEIHAENRFDRPFLLSAVGGVAKSDATQWCITLAPAPHLDADQTIFGEVADEASRDVVRAINAVPYVNMTPIEPVTISSITIEEHP